MTPSVYRYPQSCQVRGDEPHRSETFMRAPPSSSHDGQGRAVDDRLAALFGWFEAAPLPNTLESIIDQLETAYLAGRQEPGEA